ncbi:hypothetical protein [Marinobacter shengliensis]|uniref:hypothetical protein n=1 Tax=Marinobacter shengliensis TaxID=1389223 RepID=UPI002573E938|nr:hypothetical protein [Marinobacter shengliensis]
MMQMSENGLKLLFWAPLAATLLAGCGGSDSPRINSADTTASVTLNVDRSKITQGQTITLTWESQNANQCQAKGAWIGHRASSGSETVVVEKPGEAHFELACSNDESTSEAAVASIMVQERLPALIDYNAVTAGIVRVGDPIVFTWRSPNALKCNAVSPPGLNSNWSGNRPTVGFEEIVVPGTPGTYVYGLACGGATIAETTEQVSITVAPAIAAGPGPDITFVTRPDSELQVGQEVVIEWSAPGAAKCTGASSPENPQWDRLFEGSDRVSTTVGQPGNYAYSLSCSNNDGATTIENILFNVRPAGPVVTMAFDDGQSVRITAFDEAASFDWAVDSSAVSCTASGEDSRWSEVFQADFQNNLTGTFEVSSLNPGVYNYDLSCVDRNGNAGLSDSVRLVVGSAPAPDGQFSLDNSINEDKLRLDWATVNANECVPYSQTWKEWRSQSLMGGGIAGPVDVPLPDFAAGTHPLDATLICSGDNNEQGSLSKAVNIKVTEVDGALVQEITGPSTTLSASASKVVPGGALSLNWDSSDAVTCTIPRSVNQNWEESQIPLRGSRAVVAPNEPGIYTYSVSCSGSDFGLQATASTYVVVGNVSPIIESFNTPTPMATSGDTINFSWQAKNALFCETGQSGVGEWPGYFDHASTGTHSVNLPRRVDTSRYDFSLTCGIPGGPKTSQVISVTADSVGNECGILESNTVSRFLTTDMVDVKVRSIFGDGAPVIIGDGSGALSDEALKNITDGSTNTFARLTMPFGLAGLFQAYVDVYARPPLLNLDALTQDLGANKRIGFILGNPNQALQLSLLGLDSLSQITEVPVAADGAVGVETGSRDFSNTNGLTLNALFLVNDTQASFVSFPLDETLNLAGVRYAMEGGLLSVAKILDFYGACVTSEL